MARLTTDERLERLQKRYNELVKPISLIGKSFASGVEATTILSNGKREKRHFKSLDIFHNYADSLKDCNIILDNTVLAFRKDSLEAALAVADKQDIMLLADITEVTPEVQAAYNRVMIEGIIKQVS